MADTKTNEAVDAGGADSPPKSSKTPMIIGALLFLISLGGGFYASFSGMVASPLKAGPEVERQPPPIERNGAIAYVPLDELLIPLGRDAQASVLVFEAQIEIDPVDQQVFEQLKPRFADMFNTYLRAIDEADLEDPGATARLRAMLLRRVNVVAEPARARDLLITKFIMK